MPVTVDLPQLSLSFGRDLCPGVDESPLERLQRRGLKALSDAELLAV